MKTLFYILIGFTILFANNFAYSIEYKSLDERFGYWQNASTWPIGGVPPTSLNNDNITIRGTVFTVAGLTLVVNNKMTLTIDATDTLVVNGTLNLKNNITLVVNGVIVVLGNFSSQNKLTISTSGTFLVTGIYTEGNNASITLNDTTSLYIFKTNNIDPTDFQPINTPNNQVGNRTDFYTEQRPLYDWINANFNNALPITLSSFTATSGLKTILLSWTTQTETNNDYFTLERSNDGVCWSNIYMLNGVGTSTIPHVYSFVDEEIQPCMVFYRLKQTDFNGDYTYSTIVSVFPRTEGLGYSILQNPTSNNEVNILIKSDKPETIRLTLYTPSGLKVGTERIEMDANQKIIYNISSHYSLSPGLYYVTIFNEANFISTMRVVME